MKLAVVAEEEVAMGFRLAGIKETYTDPAVIEELLSRGDLAVVFIQQRIFEKTDRKLRKRMVESVKPVFVQLEGGGESIAALVKKVLGVEVK